MPALQANLTVDDDGSAPRAALPHKERRRTMTEQTRIQQGEDPAPNPSELTDAELDQVAGGGGDGAEGSQPVGSNR
jgi:hypothetical protein